MPPPTITSEDIAQLKAQLQQDWQRWMAGQQRFPERLQRLALLLLNQLLSFQTTDELTNIARDLNLSAEVRGRLGELMWQYAIYRDNTEANLPTVAQKLGTDGPVARRVLEEIKRRIFREFSPQPQLSGNVVNLKGSPQTPPSDYNR
ncbi:hypothetical protein HYZ80_03960 [Candidatus Parcubacteria bacterium]|nr:hypothetical protein [Candidatus Parcubacteria bacterium]